MDAAVEPEGDVVAGRLLAMGMQGQDLPVGPRHERLAVTLVHLTNLPQTLTMDVTGPDGRSDQVSTGPFLYVFPGARPTVSFADPPEGDWWVSVWLGGTGVLADYEVHWCADSSAAPGPQDNLACHRNR